MRITADLQCQSATADGKGRADHPVGGAKGLYLRVTAAGAKSWCVRYRRPSDGSPQRYTLGIYGDGGLSLADARAAADTIHRRLKLEKIDPADERRDHRTADSVQDLTERWLEAKAAQGRRDSYVRNNRYRLAKLPDRFLAMKAKDVQRQHVASVVTDAAKRGTSEGLAVHRIVSAVFRWAFSEGLVPTEPTAGLKKRATDKPRVRAFTTAEITALWAGLQAETCMDEATKIAISLCLHTAQRPNEVVSLRRDNLVLDGPFPTMRIDGEQAKNHTEHVVPLSNASVALLRRALEIAGDSSALAFPSPTRQDAKGRPLPIEAHALTRVISRARNAKDQTLWGVHNAQLYDCRKTCASWLGDQGFLNEAIGILLNHRSVATGSVTGRHYNSSAHLKTKREMVAAWSAHLDTLLELKSGDATAGAAIVEFPKSIARA